MDYQAELNKYKDSLSDLEKNELQKLASMQKDVAIGESAEDFIRHPFFTKFELHMNSLINDANSEIAKILAENTDPATKLAKMQANQAGIEKIKELKKWLNKYVIAGRVARQSISLYEEDTEKINAKVQSIVDKSVAK